MNAKLDWREFIEPPTHRNTFEEEYLIHLCQRIQIHTGRQVTTEKVLELIEEMLDNRLKVKAFSLLSKSDLSTLDRLKMHLRANPGIAYGTRRTKKQDELHRMEEAKKKSLAPRVPGARNFGELYPDE